MILLILVLARSTMASASPPAIHVPEPLKFDLVRGLGARAGELEGNVLLIVPATGSSDGVEWAPEIEWAPIDNFAMELELPMLDHRIEAAKLSTQLTFPRLRAGRFAHGLQLSARLPVVGVPQFHLIHVLAANVGARVGVMAMIGPRFVAATRIEPELLSNGALFVSLRSEHAVGVEVNWVRGREHGELGILPQLHLGLGRHARLQLGFGARWSSASQRWGGEAGIRVIFER